MVDFEGSPRLYNILKELVKSMETLYSWVLETFATLNSPVPP